MYLFHNYFILFAYLTWIHTIECHLVVIPERANMVHANPKYVVNATINVRRYSRKSLYYLNVMGTTKHTWTNNMTIELIVKQYLHNEYRRSFVEMRFKFCDLINKEPYVGGMLKNAGVECPMPAGRHALMNMTTQTEHFPSVFPFEKGRIDVSMTITDTGESVIQFAVEASFKQKLVREKKQRL